MFRQTSNFEITAKRDLATGRPLDAAHLRYHTMATIDTELGGYGLRVIRIVLVPGSASAFVEAIPK